jgi:crotonobetainyl-CoA:carnitine CoA-transferase CaiB-like acyl-CoA transferase
VRVQAPAGEVEATWRRLSEAGLVGELPTAGDSGLGKALADALAGMNRDKAVSMLNELGLPTAPVRRTTELVDDGAALSYGVLEPDGRPGRESWWTTGPPARFSRTALESPGPAPSLGEHTAALLGEAGYSEAEIEVLMEAGVAR